VPDLHGLESPTPTMDACEPRKDWGLTYTIREGDALARIAQAYGTYATDLALGNCLSDANVIRVGQTLRVPGEAHPVTPEWTCTPWEVLTPIDHAFDIAENGQLTFNWRGSAGKRNLIRVFNADNSLFWERTADLRQNETINLATEGFEPGNYTWQVYPLDLNFQQIPCAESPLWHFNVGDRSEMEPSAP
jgi:LysM repeat protein